MSLLTPEEQEIAFELFNDGANQVDEELSHIYYHHQCPDYRLIAQPIASYLMPLWTMDDMSTLLVLLFHKKHWNEISAILSLISLSYIGKCPKNVIHIECGMH